jgi:hypothetical protein
MPRLKCVSINGSDRPAELQAGQGKFIQPLGSGRYEVLGLLRMLKDPGYRGPVGLQNYGIRGDDRETLGQSMTVWRRMQQQPKGPSNDARGARVYYVLSTITATSALRFGLSSTKASASVSNAIRSWI